MQKKKRILLLITNLTFGGAQRVFYTQSKELATYYHVTECVFNAKDGYAFPSGNTIVDLKVPAGKNVVFKFLNFWKRVWRLRRLKRELSIDVCISHLEGADLINVLSKHKEQTITWVHGTKISDGNITGLLGLIRKKWLIPLVYSKADKVVTVSAAIQNELTHLFGVDEKKITTIYNSFDIPYIKSLAAQQLESTYQALYNSPTIILSGRLSKQKNFITFLKWFAQSNLKVKVIVLGDGELRNEILQLSKELGLKAYSIWNSDPFQEDYTLYFLGYQANPFKFLVKATLFVLPSLWEGFPMVMGEALVCNVPIAAADCPTGPRELLGFSDLTSPSINDAEYCTYGLLLPLLSNESAFPVWNKHIAELLANQELLTRFRTRSDERVNMLSREKIIHDIINCIEV